MSTPLLITVDVEGGDEPEPYGTVDEFDAFLAELGLPVTLFVTPDVVDARSQTVRSWVDADHAVGLHVHPARLGGDTDWLTEYDRPAIEEFVARGSSVFTDRLDHRPTSFRAGRWEFSETLLSALDSQGYDRDASLRPDAHRVPFERGGVAEFPLSVYRNPLVELALRPWSIDAVPLHADSFLSSRLIRPGFYLVTRRILAANRPYVMTSFHDYDVGEPALAPRLREYLTFLADRTEPRTLEALEWP